MGSQPSLPQGKSKFFIRDQYLPDRTSNADMKAVVGQISEIISKWPEIIKNIREERVIAESHWLYIQLEMKETEKAWNELTKRYFPVSRATDSDKVPNKEPNSSHMKKESQQTAMIRSLEEQLESTQRIVQDLSGKLETTKGDLRRTLERNRSLDGQRASLQKQVGQLQDEKEQLTMRLSKLAADKLMKSNPNIADLSDIYRPTKLGEVYSETYDNEYTEAFGALTDSGYTEREAVDILRDTLMNIHKFCSEKSTGLLTLTEDAIKTLFWGQNREQDHKRDKADRSQEMMRNRFTLQHGQSPEKFLLREKTEVEDLKFARKWKPKKDEQKSQENAGTHGHQDTDEGVIKKFEDNMKKLRKEVASSMVHTVQKAYFKTRWDDECIQDLKPFIEKCVFICWMMAAQTPPMAFLDLPNKSDSPLVSGKYRMYTKSGHLIDYIVWPTMMLTKDGPILFKGVAQGKSG